MKAAARITTSIAHGAIVATMLAIAMFAFPTLSERYEGVMGHLPEEYRAFQVLSNFLRANGLFVLVGLCFFLWLDFRYVAKVEKEETRTLISAGFALLLCLFVAWFVYAATGPDRFIERFKSWHPEQFKKNEK